MTSRREVTASESDRAATCWLVANDPVPVTAWRDSVVDRIGYRPDSLYTETFWLPLVGPTSLWVMRRMARWLDDSPDGYAMPLQPLAREVGLTGEAKPSSPVVRSLVRLTHFRFLAVQGDVLACRCVLPPLSRGNVARLPGHLQAQHGEWMAYWRPLLREEPPSAHHALTLVERTDLNTRG